MFVNLFTISWFVEHLFIYC